MDNENVVHNGMLFHCKGNKMIKYVGKWLELGNLMLNEVTQIQKNKFHMFFLVSGSQLQIFRFEYTAWSHNQESAQPIAILGLSHHLRLKRIVAHSYSLLSPSATPPRPFLFHCDFLQTIELLFTTTLGWDASRLLVPSFPSFFVISLGYS